ncbi:MAG: FeoA family protein [Clostridia bacterium]|nr:FeoA family protein [Clostridia bacterium]
MKPLNQLGVGQEGIVSDFIADDALTCRLNELGMTRGSLIRCLFCAPCKRLRAYLVCGAIVALRNEDAARIVLR